MIEKYDFCDFKNHVSVILSPRKEKCLGQLVIFAKNRFTTYLKNNAIKEYKLIRIRF